MFFRSIFKQIHPDLYNFYRASMGTNLFSTFFFLKNFSDLASSAPKGLEILYSLYLCFLVLY